MEFREKRTAIVIFILGVAATAAPPLQAMGRNSPTTADSTQVKTPVRPAYDNPYDSKALGTSPDLGESSSNRPSPPVSGTNTPAAQPVGTPDPQIPPAVGAPGSLGT